MKVTKGERSTNLMYLIAKPICFLVHKSTAYTVDENINATTKMRNNFCYPL